MSPWIPPSPDDYSPPDQSPPAASTSVVEDFVAIRRRMDAIKTEAAMARLADEIRRNMENDAPKPPEKKRRVSLVDEWMGRRS